MRWGALSSLALSSLALSAGAARPMRCGLRAPCGGVRSLPAAECRLSRPSWWWVDKTRSAGSRLFADGGGALLLSVPAPLRVVQNNQGRVGEEFYELKESVIVCSPGWKALT